MKVKVNQRLKRLISGLAAAATVTTMLPQMPAFAETGSTTYSYDGYDVEYSVLNEWDNGQSVEVRVTNTGDDSILNWAFKYDAEGEIGGLWNASVYNNQGENYIIKNGGWNYEIAPGQTVDFGYTLFGDDLAVPEKFELCSKRVEVVSGYETSLNVVEQWDKGIKAELSVTNTSDEPIEAWELSFDTNFAIDDLWEGRILDSADNHYTIASEMWTNPIYSGDSKVIGFTAAIDPALVPEITNVSLTRVIIDGASNAPEIPDEPHEHTILCFGEYIKDENAVIIYWDSTDKGTVSLYESETEGEWVKIADGLDENSYKYEIAEDFQAKQIKAVQETNDGTLESEPFTVTFSEGEYICTLPDDDNDGLFNIIEEIYGTDPRNPDTDGDRLTDYEEVYITGTDPLKYDTDDNGINDADDDSDGDGLSNREEIELGTDPCNTDTDGDGLSDYDELNQYNTDPLEADSDGDTLNDGDELAIGLDPNNPETFGIPDAEYKVEQIVAADSEALKKVNTDESPYKLSLEVTASGNVNGNLNADISSYSTTINSDIQLGETIDLNYIGGDVAEVKLSFTIDDAYIDNELGLFPDEEELQGIKRLNVFKYFEDINMLLPIETVIDEETNTISAMVDELGTYCVVDMEKWLSNLLGADMPEAVNFMSDDDEFYIEVEETLDYSEEETRISNSLDAIEEEIMSDEITAEETLTMSYVPAMYAAPYAPGFNPVEKVTPVDVVFLLQSAGAREYDFKTQSTMIKDVMDKLQKSHGKDNVRVCVITYDLLGATILSPNTWFTNSADLQDALSDITYKYTSGYVNRGAAFSKLISNVAFKKVASKFVFQVMNGSTDVGSGYFSQLDACSRLSINYTELIPEGYSYRSSAYANDVAKAIAKTKGLNLIYNSKTSTTTVYNHICKYAAPTTTEYMVLIANSWKKIKLEGVLDPDSDTDTDKDGLSDWDEVNKGLITFGADGSPQLPKFGECTSLPNRPYVYNGLNRFCSSWINPSTDNPLFNFLNYDLYVLPIISDPTNKDSDGDGFLDGTSYIDDNGELPKDPSPLKFEIIPYLQDLCELATDYESNFAKSQILVVNYLRAGIYYTFEWEGISGKIDQKFIDYVNSNNPKIQEYLYSQNIEDNKYIKDPITGKLIDFTHLAATFSSYLHEASDFERWLGSILYDVPYHSEDDLNNLMGWAGDLQSMIQTDLLICYDKSYGEIWLGDEYFDEETLNKYNEYYYKDLVLRLLEDKPQYDSQASTHILLDGKRIRNTAFKIEDQLADIDAVNLFVNYYRPDQKTTFFDCVNGYYNGGLNFCELRYDVFIHNVFSMDSDYTYGTKYWEIESKYPGGRANKECADVISELFYEYTLKYTMKKAPDGKKWRLYYHAPVIENVSKGAAMAFSEFIVKQWEVSRWW